MPVPRRRQTFGKRFVRFSAISVKPNPRNCAAVVANAAAPIASGMPGNRPLSAKGHRTRSPIQFREARKKWCTAASLNLSSRNEQHHKLLRHETLWLKQLGVAGTSPRVLRLHHSLLINELMVPRHRATGRHAPSRLISPP